MRQSLQSRRGSVSDSPFVLKEFTAQFLSIANRGIIWLVCISTTKWLRTAKQEIIRRYYSTKRDIKRHMMEEAIEKISVIMKKLGITVDDRLCVKAALEKAKVSGTHAMAIELNDGTIITGRRTKLLDAPAAMLLNALKYFAKVDDDLKLISPSIIEPIQTLNKQYLGVRNPRLHVNDVLIALSINACRKSPSAVAKTRPGPGPFHGLFDGRRRKTSEKTSNRRYHRTGLQGNKISTNFNRIISGLS